MSDKIVCASGTGLTASLHPNGPKWTLECGVCHRHWRQRITKIDNPTLHCPWCDTPNILQIVWSTRR